MTLIQSHFLRFKQSYKLAKLCQLTTRASRIKNYCELQPVVKLNIGCGPTAKAGWLNIDLDPRLENAIYMDATQPLALQDATVDFAYSEHMIEHVPLNAAIKMLGEIHRVLKPGGMVRIATPEMDNFLRLKNDKLNNREESYVRWSNLEFGSEFERASPQNPCYAINRMFHEWGHQFIYDRPTLAELLSHIGFRDVTFCEIGQSDVPEFRNIETHGTVVGEEFNLIETMIAEARKP